MELNTIANQPACYDTPGNLLLKMLDEEGRHYNDDIQEIFQNSEVGNVAFQKVDPRLASNNPDTEVNPVSVLNGEYCELATQLSIDYMDIFEILREEILAAEAREFEVIENGLLYAGEGHEESSRDENRVEGFESSFVRECEVTGIDRGDGRGYAENCPLQDKAALMHVLVRKEEDDGQVESLVESPNGGLFENAFLKEVKDMGGQNYEAASSGDRKVENKPTELRDSASMQVFLLKEDGQAESLGSPNSRMLEDAFLQEDEGLVTKDPEAAPSEDNKVGLENHVLHHDGIMSAPSEDNKVGSENYALRGEGVISAEAREVGVVHGHQNAEESGPKESSDTSNVEVNGDMYSREDEGTGTDKINVPLLDNNRGDEGDQFLQNEKPDTLSEHSEDDDYTSGAFSGPMAFSGMLSYSGMISYPGQIPYSGNLSLHSDSSTSTRSFAFPILASDWNSSPAKIGQPDGRYFRRRRRWRPRFCCRRPTTLFD